MPKKYTFRVSVREVYARAFRVEAESEAQALVLLEQCEEGPGVVDLGNFEYSHTLDPSEWIIEKYKLGARS